MTNDNTAATTIASLQPATHLNHPVRVLKLGLDVYLLQHVVAIQYDGSRPKPPQRLTPKDFLAWANKTIKGADVNGAKIDSR